MKNLRFILAVLIVSISGMNAQQVHSDERFNFSIQHPDNWIKAKPSESIENLQSKIKLSQESIDMILKNHQGTIEIVTFYKYPTNSVNGIIPTIKVNLRKNPTKNFAEFKEMMVQGAENLKKPFPNLQITKQISVTKIDGIECVYFESTNKIPTKNGNEEYRTLTYAVPVGDNFYQINFIDKANDNCTNVFNEILNSIDL